VHEMATMVPLLRPPFAHFTMSVLAPNFYLLFSVAPRFAANRFGLPVKIYALDEDYFFTPRTDVLCSLGNTKFDDRLRWNLDLLLRLEIKARACFPLLLHQFAKIGQDNSPVFLIFL